MAERQIAVGQGMVDEAHGFILKHTPIIVDLINRVREHYAQSLKQKISPVTRQQVESEVERLFRDHYTALNLSALIVLANSLQAEEDYEAFVVDEILGQAIAEAIAPGLPYRNFAQGTFHLLDALFKDDLHRVIPRRSLASDDALAGIAAGLEAVLPGWEWMKRPVILK